MLKLIVILFFAAFATACSKKDNKNTDTATFGYAKIGCDESYKPIVEAQLDIFHYLYKYAHITPVYMPEEQIFNELLKDSVRLVVATRKLRDDELAVFKAAKITPRYTKVATDAVALVVNIKNLDSLITIYQLKDILTGKLKKWNNIHPQYMNADIQVVFDNNNSSNLRYLLDTFKLTSKQIAANIFSANSHTEAIEYVKNNPNALGVIGVNWISDGDDSTTKDFLKSIKILAVSRLLSPTRPGEYFQPYQAYVAQGWYPLSRDLLIVSREARVGLGTGFAAFFASERGQRIILKAGLVPATMPVRIINVKKSNL
ncbi:MAG: substrate-binding domain-containing protein [Cytophagales bacterium]|nr:substrate-binding domain-containing protein [Cytophagales bacterium]